MRRLKYSGGVTLGAGGQSQVAGTQGVNVESQCADLNPNSLFLRRQDIWQRRWLEGVRAEGGRFSFSP